MTAQQTAYNAICKAVDTKTTKLTHIPKTPEGCVTVPVPNEVFTHKQLYKLAEAFGNDQPYKTFIHKDLYKKYSAEELCGSPQCIEPNRRPVRFIHIPKEYNVERGSAQEQAKQHKDGHVPTVLETICYWFTLRELGETLDFDTTYIRHFDLQPKRLDDWLVVPGSYVNDDGELYLAGADAGAGRGGRLAVGSNLGLRASSSAAPLSSTGTVKPHDLQMSLEANTEATENLSVTIHELNDTLRGIFNV